LLQSVNCITILTFRQCRKALDDVISLINQIDLVSSRAQGLSHIIITFSSFSNSDNKLYILVTNRDKRVLGFVIVSVRNLFPWDRKDVQHEKKIFCFPDLFTYPNYQRQRRSKCMIDAILEDQQLQASFGMERRKSSEF
jgi:hypothetical protein